MRDMDRESALKALERLSSATLNAPTAYVEDFARIDVDRAGRKGVPEVVLAERKTPEQTVAIARRMLQNDGRAIVSRAPEPILAALAEAFGDGVSFETSPGGRMTVLRQGTQPPPQDRGVVGIVSAGTSDLPAAGEAATLCREMGCRVEMVTDVGVAGLHRLFEPLKMLLEVPVDVIVVAAGMDGALPSVITGLVDVPVVGLPTAVGYGMGGDGVAALLAMLQSCAPGLAVVNIDNGVGAGAMAGMIAVRAGKARRHG